jgi:hypothetical protein
MVGSVPSKWVRSWRFALIASLMVHVSIVFFLAARTSNSGSLASTTQLVIQSPPISEAERAKHVSSLQSDPVSAQLSVSELQQEVDAFDNNPDQRPTASEGSSSYVASQIQRSVRVGRRRSPERNQKELETLSERLARESNEKSVEELAKFLGGIVGPPRAVAPSEKDPTKPFDPKTAQIHDVAKVVDEKMGTQFIATLVDASGVAIEIELDRDLGEQLYKTMQLIKSNPLLERVYRQMVMGLMDQILDSQKAGTP